MGRTRSFGSIHHNAIFGVTKDKHHEFVEDATSRRLGQDISNHNRTCHMVDAENAAGREIAKKVRRA